MKRRTFLAAGAGCSLARAANQKTTVPRIAEPHFPSPLYQFVWRNWELASLERMASTIRTQPANVLRIGRSMGLPPKPRLSEDQLRRIYITVIRQNWHLLPLDQLRELLGWTEEKLAFTLREDDFLDVKLGPKPDCAPVVFAAPSPSEKRRATEIRKILASTLGSDLRISGEPAFDFVTRLSRSQGAQTLGAPARKAILNPRYLYSFFALYGDPLLETDIDPFPDGYLEKLADVGINGVWLQCVLNGMAPSKVFPEFGHRSEERLANLNKLVERAGRFGVKVYLYLNEPRSMPPEFFKGREEIRGAESMGRYAMCTTVPVVREWISDSLAYVFERVPHLGGTFCITMSENLTNCFSKLNPKACPRCPKRTDWEVVREVLEAIRQGVRRSSQSADVIYYDWAWPQEMCRKLIPVLPTDARLLSVSEWSMPIERGGVKTQVGEYSISVVGPGPRSLENWSMAKQAGVSVVAKTQLNNTWEISAVPYIPVPNLVARHCENLLRAGVSGIMASWTLGGYPSPNLEVAAEFYFEPTPAADEVLERVARRRYGAEAAPGVLQAWKGFSQAFELYPYSVSIYTIPTQHGPANLLRATPTGVAKSMILFPQDDYKAWAGKYTPEIVRREFSRMADLWEQSLPTFRAAIEKVPGDLKARALEDLAIAETCQIHFRSTANQVEFYILRDGARTPQSVARMRELAKMESDLARRLYVLARRHSVLAYEASNHYYYRPLDLAEKILNCQHVAQALF